MTERTGGHTEGPWRWELNQKHKTIQLCGGNPKGGYGKFDLTVMDFVRYGTQGAAPRFRDGSDHGLLTRAEHFGQIAEGREHHADWFKLLSQPDANLIAAAPNLFAALQGVVAAWVNPADGAPFEDGEVPALDIARTTLSKITQSTSGGEGR